jgi:hypothetical protein
MSAVTLVDLSSSSSTPQSKQQYNIIQLPEPGSDDGTRDYIIVTQQQNQSNSWDIFEIQSVRPNAGKYASFFVGSRIISHPELYVTTRVDPLFFALSHFHSLTKKGDAQSDKWQPWDQALTDLPLPILRALGLDTTLNINGIHEVGQLAFLLDVSDMCGDDLLLCKFSEESTLKWLEAKFQAALKALRMRLMQRKRRDVDKKNELIMSGGAKSSSFNMVNDDTDIKKQEEKKEEETDEVSKDQNDLVITLSKKEEESLRAGALQLICDYIPDEWRQKLTEKLEMNEADWKGKSKTKDEHVLGGKRPRASWEGNHGQEDADALLQYTMGTNSNSGDKSSDAKKGVKNAQSSGLKRLAKVNKKGMKSLSSFFGAKKKQKK